ncbi:hypothetical protein T4D_11950 [Trichinella pseudospiralis]|uniref:Uncharacterized protein n=1 Tax=Trichinella pseudospiralis TaxID=6337 RepID=A0A0V1FQN1_TRIPS|nr:hypothetical protein T4D_11950 [Trichinella pseudospiralis]
MTLSSTFSKTFSTFSSTRHCKLINILLKKNANIALSFQRKRTEDCFLKVHFLCVTLVFFMICTVTESIFLKPMVS